MTSTTAALDYYTACAGAWRAPLALRLDDAAALRASGMRWLDRMSVHLLARWPAWLGPVVMDTTVDVEDARTVRHTTVVRWLGVPLQRSVETFHLDADGQHLTVRGGMTGDATADLSARHVAYTLRWLGVTIDQHTTLAGDTVTVVQRGPGFSAEHVLQRRSAR